MQGSPLPPAGSNGGPDTEGVGERPLLVRFAELWSGTGDAPDTFAFLAAHPAATLNEQYEIVRLDLQYRAERHRSLPIEQYFSRLPLLEQDPETKLCLITQHFRSATHHGPRTEVAEYLRRFPELGQELRVRLEQFSPTPGNVSEASETFKDNPSAARTEIVNPGESARRDATGEVLPGLIGRYRVQRKIGEGGFGRVYLAVDEGLRRQVAIKVWPAERFAGTEDAEDYLKEARAIARLDHPQIVPVHDHGRMPDGSCYVVSKFIEGTNLAVRMAESRFPYREAAEIAKEMAEALGYAHASGVIHRDIKPGNIMMDGRGKPHLIDFGLAMREEDLGRQQECAGTPSYMSPEQVRGEGHLVDGRTDIFSLGVVFYEMLTGARPFNGKDSAEIFERVKKQEAKPLRQVDANVPKELERICLKALNKKVRDRYSTAEDFAADLRAFLAAEPLVAIPAPVKRAGAAPRMDTTIRSVRIVPSGLRSYDEESADFFLALLPGARDRNGLPDSVRFWKTRIEATDADKTFRVGLLYGPSGCGKSSLVKAGVMPRLNDSVIPVYLEASMTDTEARLLHHLRKACPHLPEKISLVEALMALRRGQYLPPDQKVLIVLDQFEQWLHAHQTYAEAELTQVLRQCDGEHVQCLLLVRDDFWLAVSRFLNELEIRQEQDRNTALVDLFDPLHARKVLIEFGRAYDRLPVKEETLAPEQEEFIELAIAGLQQEGKVISVRLALFAEMFKGRPWTVSALKEIGGAAGVGVTFLHETFSARAADSRHRQHEAAVREVLFALLPEEGSDIKGGVRSYEELLAVSGYAERSADFDEVMAILDGELRLLTPVEGPERAGAAAAGGRGYYQLTHDFLVPSVREWLTMKQRETRRGRALLCLAERASSWGLHPSPRQLPTWWEWLNIVALTSGARWTAAQRRMVAAASKYHLLRGGAILLLATMLGWVAWDRYQQLNAEMLYANLLKANTVEAPSVARLLQPQRHRLAEQMQSDLATFPPESRQRLHLAMALLPADPRQADFLLGYALTNSTAETLLASREALEPVRTACVGQLWSTLKNIQIRPDIRFRAAALLAGLDSQNADWQAAGPDAAQLLLTENVIRAAQWADLFHPVHLALEPTLQTNYVGQVKPETVSVAGLVLAELNKDNAPKLVELLQSAPIDLLPAFYSYLLPHIKEAGPVLERAFSTSFPAGLDDDQQSVLLMKRAKVGILMGLLGNEAGSWPGLIGGADPIVQTMLVNHSPKLGLDPLKVLQRLGAAAKAEERYALLLMVGTYPNEILPPSRRADWIPVVESLFSNDADAAVHSAARWVLTRWGQTNVISVAETEWRSRDPHPGRSWQVNLQGQSLVIVKGPVQFWMGSPSNEVYRSTNELRHSRIIPRTYAIGTLPVTVDQFDRFMKRPLSESRLRMPRDGQFPMDGADQAIGKAYCQWLSMQEGIPEAEYCYRFVRPHTNGYPVLDTVPDYLNKNGYRLPTEAEWEYAARAGSTQTWYTGCDYRLLPEYEWIRENSEDVAHGVGLLKPNRFGLFDLFTAYQVCQNSYVVYPDSGPDSPAYDFPSHTRGKEETWRGTWYGAPAQSCRLAYRVHYYSSVVNPATTIRVARTLESKEPIPKKPD